MTEHQYTLKLDLNPTEDELSKVDDALREFNTPVIGPENYSTFAVFVQDSEGAFQGGLTCKVKFGWLYLADLWLPEILRGHGYGRQLIEVAENEGRRRGCRHAHLDTFEFQALTFYKHLGYEVWGTLDDFVPDHTQYHLRKKL